MWTRETRTVATSSIKVVLVLTNQANLAASQQSWYYYKCQLLLHFCDFMRGTNHEEIPISKTKGIISILGNNTTFLFWSKVSLVTYVIGYEINETDRTRINVVVWATLGTSTYYRTTCLETSWM